MHFLAQESTMAEALKALLPPMTAKDQQIHLRADKSNGSIAISVASSTGVAVRCSLFSDAQLNVETSGTALVDGRRLSRIFMLDGTSRSVSFSTKESTERFHTRSTCENEEQIPICGTLLIEKEGCGQFGLAMYKHDWEPVFGSGKLLAVLNDRTLIENLKFVVAYEMRKDERPRFRNAGISISGEGMTIVVTNGFQLAMTHLPVSEFYEKASLSVDMSRIKVVASLIKEKSPVSLTIQTGQILMSQNLVLNEKKIGVLEVRVPLSSTGVVSFEKAIKNLRFSTSCKINTADFRQVCLGLDVVERVRTRIFLDTKNRVMNFSKSDEDSFVREFRVGVLDAAGPSIEIDVSSSHLALPASQSQCDTLEIKFSGQRSLAAIFLSANRVVYFPPFAE